MSPRAASAACHRSKSSAATCCRRVAGPIIVQASIFAAYALLFETGLAYLGLTASSNSPTWGGMVAEASTVIEQQEWLLIPSGVLIAVTILAFGLVGDAARDAAAMEDAAPAHRRRTAVPRDAAGRAAAGDAAAGHAAPASQPGAPPVDENALLSVRGLSVTGQGRSGQTLVVDSVSFDVFPGETVGLVGESGCGKTLTALAVLRLLPGSLAVAGGQAQLGRPRSAADARSRL